MIGLTNTQQQIQTSLITAISNNNLKAVQDIFNNDEYDDIQAVLSHEGTLTSDKEISFYILLLLALTL